MPDIFDNFKKILRKDVSPIFIKYLKDSNNNFPENFNSFIEDPQTFLTDLFEKFSKNKDNNINQGVYTNIENITDIDPAFENEYEYENENENENENEYDELFKRLISIEENMIQIEKILKDKS